MAWGFFGLLAAFILVGVGLLVWNNRQARSLAKSKERERIMSAAQKLQKNAEKVRARKRRTGTDLLDSLQNRGRDSDRS